MDEKKLEDVAMGATGSGVNTWHGRRIFSAESLQPLRCITMKIIYMH